MKRFERLPMISLDKKEFNDVKKKVVQIKKKIGSWKKFNLKIKNEF